MDVSTIWDFCGEVVGSIRPRKGYVPATVTRIDADGTVWVTTGDGTEAPASTCATGVAVGDVVSVSWSGTQMGVVGNESDPAAGTSTVRAVRKAAESAAKVASGAQAIADAIGQHFWADDSGAHVSTEKDNPTGERNILMNSLGILLRQGSAWLASFSDSAVAFYDGLGNAAANVVAQFGADGAVIGRSGESHMELDYHSMRMIDRDGNEYFEVEDFRDADGYLNETFEGDGVTTDFYVSFNVVSVAFVKVDGVEVSYTVRTTRIRLDAAPPSGAVVEIRYMSNITRTTAYTFGTRADGSKSGSLSVAEGRDVTASGFESHAEGWNTKASGYAAHAEGYGTKASERYAHAEGNLTTASGLHAHAEGSDTTASGQESHAEGSGCEASGTWSHAQNRNTIAAFDSQTAIGKWNDNDSANVFEVGNGTADDARSNAFAVTLEGDLEYSGSLDGKTWHGDTYGTTSGGRTALPAEGTYILVTGHSSTPALNGIWIIRTTANKAFNLAGGGNVTITVSGTLVTVTTTSGTVNVYYQYCGV